MEKHDITIFVDQRQVELPQGKYTGAQIKTKGNVPAGNLLYRIDGKERHEIADGQEVEIHPNEHFVSAPPVGGAS